VVNPYIARFISIRNNTVKKLARLAVALSALLGLAVASTLHAAEPTPLKAGDRIVFFGDSITGLGAREEHGYVKVMQAALNEKLPDLKVECLGAGQSGNKVPDLQKRVDKDVIKLKKPTIVFVYIGINDVWHGQKIPEKGTTPEAFEAGLKEVIGKLQAAGARVILCTPSVIGEKKAGANPLDAKLDQFSDISRGVAKEMNLQLCDLRKAFVDYLAENNPNDKETGILTRDKVHLKPDGNKLVAETMLKSLGL
jgi:lysophospholipase L1-like esterase